MNSDVTLSYRQRWEQQEIVRGKESMREQKLLLDLKHCHMSGYKISKCAEYLSVSVPAAQKLMSKYLNEIVDKAMYETKVKA